MGGKPFGGKMARLVAPLRRQRKKAARLDKAIEEGLKAKGFEQSLLTEYALSDNIVRRIFTNDNRART